MALTRRPVFVPSVGLRELAPDEKEPTENCHRSFMTTCYALNLENRPYCRKCENLWRTLHGPMPRAKPTQHADSNDPTPLQMCFLLVFVALVLTPLMVFGPVRIF